MPHRIDVAEHSPPLKDGSGAHADSAGSDFVPTEPGEGIQLSELKVLLVHSYYQQPGGEDVVFDAESQLLERHGHQVVRYTRNNGEVDNKAGLIKAADAIWNRVAAKEVREIVRTKRIDIVHVHNEFPVISPTVFKAARQAGAAVVKTLHNVRPLCPKAVCFRDGQACDVCVKNRIAWRGIWEGCYRNSQLATAVSSLSSLIHRYAGSYRQHIDACVAPTNHVKQVYLDSGYPISDIFVKPHFVEDDLGEGTGQGGYVLYAGRLSAEKGIHVLLDAWKQMTDPPELHVIGDGPLAEQVRVAGGPVRWFGHLPINEVYDRMGQAACLVLPSTCAETFGRVAVESFSRGTPVICANRGGQAEVVQGLAGRQFKPGDSRDLARQVEEMFADPSAYRAQRRAARQAYEEHFHAGLNYEQLLDVYRKALIRRGRRISSDPTPTYVDDHDQLGRRTSDGRETVRVSS